MNIGVHVNETYFIKINIWYGLSGETGCDLNKKGVYNTKEYCMRSVSRIKKNKIWDLQEWEHKHIRLALIKQDGKSLEICINWQIENTMKNLMQKTFFFFAKQEKIRYSRDIHGLWKINLSQREQGQHQITFEPAIFFYCEWTREGGEFIILKSLQRP